VSVIFPNQDNKVLIIVATNFPYQNGEPYLEDELKIISPNVSKIIIALPEGERNRKLNQVNTIPKNVEIVLFSSELKSSEKFTAIFSLLSVSVLKEFFNLKFFTKAKYSVLTLKTMADSFLRAKKFEKELEKYLLQNNLLKNNLSLVSYWCTEYSLSLVNISKKHKSVSVFSRLHAWDIYLERNYGNYLPFRKEIFEGLKKGLVISKNGLEYIFSNFNGIDKKKFIVSALGVLPGKFWSSNKQNHKLRILTLAFISKVKRMERIIEAFENIDPQIEIDWIHIGDGNFDYSKFENLAKDKLSKKKNIQFSLLGKMSKQEVYNFLDSTYFDLLLNSSDTEGLPVSMMECMARGIPVVAPNLGGIPEIVEHKKNGYLLSKDTNSEEIKKTIEFFINLENSEYEKYRKNAFETWGKKYDAQKNYSHSLDEFFN